MSVVDRGVSFGVLTSGFQNAPGVLTLAGPNPKQFTGPYTGDSGDFEPVDYTVSNTGFSTFQYSVTVNNPLLVLGGSVAASLQAGASLGFTLAVNSGDTIPGRYQLACNVANLTTGVGSVSVPVEVVIQPATPFVTYQGYVPGGLHFTWVDPSFSYYPITGFEVEWKIPQDPDWLFYGTLPPNHNAVVIDYGIGDGDTWQFRIRAFLDGQGARIYGAWGEFSGTA